VAGVSVNVWNANRCFLERGILVLHVKELSKPQTIDVVVAVHPSGISGARNVSEEIEPFAWPAFQMSYLVSEY
jgi:hypothetical protein